MENDVEKIMKIKEKFDKKLSILERAKENIMRIFKAKLEEKKEEEIKRQISSNIE